MTVTAVVVGNPKPGSRTLAVARRAAEALTGRASDVVVDLVEHVDALVGRDDDDLSRLRDVATGCDLLVLGSPTYRGSVTGLLKLFLDQLPTGSLEGVVAVPVMLGGDLRHSLAPDVFLRPVLIELGASCPTPSLFVVESECDEPEPLATWTARAKAGIS